jgi:hypothetical protein
MYEDDADDDADAEGDDDNDEGEEGDDNNDNEAVRIKPSVPMVLAAVVAWRAAARQVASSQQQSDSKPGHEKAECPFSSSTSTI